MIIRFSAALVVVGLGLLLAGAIASNMTLVYAAIAVSVCAALVLAAGMIVGRDELFGRGATAEGAGRALGRGVTPGPGRTATQVKLQARVCCRWMAAISRPHQPRQARPA